MRNQTSFRLTTTLLPWDMTAKTTTVINKLDSNGEKFYPSFTEETVVLTNDDRTVMETTRAICTDWALTFIKRWLSDAVDPVTWVETEIPSRKLTWNPWSLAFITASAGDFIDKDDSITWTGNQTYTGNLVSQWSATYNWLLTTNKWVKYPSFENLEALEAYNDPFPWMFAVLDSDWELYRYNAVTETWSVVTTSEPTNPPQASTSTIWTVRGATSAEFAAWTATGSQWELLVATPAQIQSVTPAMSLHYTNVNLKSDDLTGVWSKSVSWTVPHDWFLTITWWEFWSSASQSGGDSSCNRISVSWTSTPIRVSKTDAVNDATMATDVSLYHQDLYIVKAWTFTVTITNDYALPTSASWWYWWVKIESFFYFW